MVTGGFRACLVDPEPQRHREAAGRAKTVGGMTQSVYRGLSRLRSRVIQMIAANTLARLLRLLAA
jgi:hypothetical protein